MSVPRRERTGIAAAAGRASVVVAVLTVQAVAFAAAYAVGRPTLYALFAVGSAATLAAATGGGPRGAVAAAATTALLGGVYWASGQPWFAAALAPVADPLRSVPVLGVLADPGPRGVWVFLLGPVALSAVAATVDDRWEGVAAATLGTVLLVALGLPLALFLAGQDLSLVVREAATPEVQRMLAFSLAAPSVAAAFSVAVGVPLAYLLSRGFPGRSLVESLVDLPLVIPHSVAGIIVLFGFGSGAAFPGLQVLNGVAGMVLAMTFVSAPYAVDAARGAFDAVDRSLVRAARSHGAGPFEAFRRVTLPLSARGILTGGILAWARAVSEFGAVAVVAYSVSVAFPTATLPPAFETLRTQHAPVYIYNTYVTQGLPAAGAVATLLLGVSAVLFLLVRWVAYDDRGGVLS